MAHPRKAANPHHVETHAAADTWSSLTWDDLDDWAGSRCVSRGQAYQRQGDAFLGVREQVVSVQLYYADEN